MAVSLLINSLTLLLIILLMKGIIEHTIQLPKDLGA